MIKAVAFDAVGTLIHPAPPAPEVYAEVGRRFGSRLGVEQITPRFREAFVRQEKLDWLHDLRTSEEREVERWRAIVGEVLDDVSEPEACFAELYDHFGRPGAWAVEPDAAPLIYELRWLGYPVVLASNYDRRLRAVAAGLAELEGVSRLVISSEVGWRKPARAYFEALAIQLGRDRSEILLVGDDRVNDFDGARAAGMPVLLFDPRSRHLGVAPARLRSLRDLPAALED